MGKALESCAIIKSGSTDGESPSESNVFASKESVSSAKKRSPKLDQTDVQGARCPQLHGDHVRKERNFLVALRLAQGDRVTE